MSLNKNIQGTANYTPIYIKNDEIIEICTIESLILKYGNKIFNEDNVQVYEFNNIESWTDEGWKQVKYSRKYDYSKQSICRIVTNNGLVDVTDYSYLLNVFGEKNIYNKIEIGDNLLHFNLCEKAINSFNIYHDLNSIYINGNDDMIKAARYVNFLNSEKKRYEIINFEDSNIINIKMIKQNNNKNLYSIIQNHSIPYNHKYVYDLVTTNGHYAAGVGNIIINAHF